jgi:hypothetical protein
MDPEKDTDLEKDLEMDPESKLNPWQSGLQIAKSVLGIAKSQLWISKSVVAFAIGLPQFCNKLQNCQACGIPISNFYWWL